ncbi:MAG: hypothetical protein JW754_03230 [Candidatus Aenigmarchaeota archaeon]|nr:hypothetical protein [Candidatus Aenigmarchaeota archaeon]
MKDGNLVGVIIIIFFAVSITLVTMNMVMTTSETLDPELVGTMTTEEIQLYLSERGSSNMLLLYLIPLLAFAGLLVGVISYRFMSNGKSAESHIKKDGKVILNFLNLSERNVIEKIMESGGKCQQVELSRLPGLSKVKTHRILNDMERKGIIKRERYGKINMIVLDRGLKEALTG